MLHTITRAVLIYTHIYIYIHCVRKIQSLVKHTDHGEKKKTEYLCYQKDPLTGLGSQFEFY
jgi:hypothetical protein